MELTVSAENKPLDPHKKIKYPDFGILYGLYAGRKPFRGDFHCHAATGGTSDGKATLAEWKAAASEFGLDFIAVMDHRQVRHMYIENYDPDFFMAGTEPAITFSDMKIPGPSIHYLMFFRKPEDLSVLLDKFPDVYGFTGYRLGTEGHFEYRAVPRERFSEIIDEVYRMGGFVSHPHPIDVMKSDNTLDYFFGDGVGFEVMYRMNDRITNGDYRLWTELLAMGKKPVMTSTDDTHGKPENMSKNTVYLKKRTNDTLIDALRSGDVNGGKCGIRLCIGNASQGSVCSEDDLGKPFTYIASDLHSSVPEGHTYRLDVVTDRGIAYSEEGSFPFTGAIETQPDRLFYRIEVYDLTENRLFALSNPVYCR
ncbi:MAG: hypothetical protein MJ137_08860 [Clostridia bacterium]|nr:hypothetical protein [Clostridia bacterium]